MIKEIKRKGYVCNQCSHEWVGRPKAVKIPILCPNPDCHSYYWNEPKRNKR